MDFEKSRSQREQEEKSLINAWYNMVSDSGHPAGGAGRSAGLPKLPPQPSLQGVALQQRVGEERAPAHAQSFLAQQRLVINARRGLLGRQAALSARPLDKL